MVTAKPTINLQDLIEFILDNIDKSYPDSDPFKFTLRNWVAYCTVSETVLQEVCEEIDKKPDLLTTGLIRRYIRGRIVRIAREQHNVRPFWMSEDFEHKAPADLADVIIRYYKIKKAKSPGMVDRMNLKSSEGAGSKPGPKGPRVNTARRRLDIKAVAKQVAKSRGWETKACMSLNTMKTPLPSKKLRNLYRGDWLNWLRTDREAFLKQWSRDVNSD